MLSGAQKNLENRWKKSGGKKEYLGYPGPSFSHPPRPIEQRREKVECTVGTTLSLQMRFHFVHATAPDERLILVWRMSLERVVVALRAGGVDQRRGSGRLVSWRYGLYE